MHAALVSFALVIVVALFVVFSLLVLSVTCCVLLRITFVLRNRSFPPEASFGGEVTHTA